MAWSPISIAREAKAISENSPAQCAEQEDADVERMSGGAGARLVSQYCAPGIRVE